MDPLTTPSETEQPETPAYERLFEALEAYFANGESSLTRKICRTSLPPIYFQHPGKCDVRCKRRLLTKGRPLDDDRWSREEQEWRSQPPCLRSHVQDVSWSRSAHWQKLQGG